MDVCELCRGILANGFERNLTKTVDMMVIVIGIIEASVIAS